MIKMFVFQQSSFEEALQRVATLVLVNLKVTFKPDYHIGPVTCPCSNKYSKTCLKRSLKKRQNKDLYDKW